MNKLITKRRILLITVILLVVVLIVFILKTDSTTPPTPIQGDIKLLQVTPPEGIREMLFMGTAIIFEFDSPLDISTVVAKVTPSIDIEIVPGKDNLNTVAVKPVSEWKDGKKYQISISKELSSTNNKILREDIVHTFTFNTPTDIMNYHPYSP